MAMEQARLLKWMEGIFFCLAPFCLLSHILIILHCVSPFRGV